jgi:DNA-binding CsgD family transcriptional regulator
MLRDVGRYDHVLHAARRLEHELEVALSDGNADNTAERLCAAAEDAVRAGNLAEAVELLDRGEAARPRRAVLARLRYVRSMADPTFWDANGRGRTLLIAEARAVEQQDPALATKLFVAAALDGTGELDALAATAQAAILAARRAGPAAAADACLAAETARLLAGEAAGGDALERALASFDREAFDAPTQLHRIAVVAFWSEDYGTARQILERLLEIVRGTGHNLLPRVLDTLAAVDLRTGRWPSAEKGARDALRLATASGDGWQQASCSTTLALLAALTGRELECRLHLVAAGQLAPRSELIAAWSAAISGLLELGMRRPEAAIAQLARVSRIDGLGPNVLLWLPNLIEACAHAQRGDEARAHLETFEEQAGRSRSHLAVATLSRCRGLMARSGFEVHFAEALDLHAAAQMPFETARTQLCFGERLRRARRTTDARAHLHAAVTTFEFLGARPWAARAQTELDAIRGTAARAPESPTGLLTAHELQVASLVVRGATNREAASALFVSPKTIDYHLGNIYRKLGVRSRTELTRALGRSL